MGNKIWKNTETLTSEFDYPNKFFTPCFIQDNRKQYLACMYQEPVNHTYPTPKSNGNSSEKWHRNTSWTWNRSTAPARQHTIIICNFSFPSHLSVVSRMVIHTCQSEAQAESSLHVNTSVACHWKLLLARDGLVVWLDCWYLVWPF